jgi:hypothetical protein
MGRLRGGHARRHGYSCARRDGFNHRRLYAGSTHQSGIASVVLVAAMAAMNQPWLDAETNGGRLDFRPAAEVGILGIVRGARFRLHDLNALLRSLFHNTMRASRTYGEL